MDFPNCPSCEPRVKLIEYNGGQAICTNCKKYFELEVKVKRFMGQLPNGNLSL